MEIKSHVFRWDMESKLEKTRGGGGGGNPWWWQGGATLVDPVLATAAYVGAPFMYDAACIAPKGAGSPWPPQQRQLMWMARVIHGAPQHLHILYVDLESTSV